MIYFDNAATSFPKPACVKRAVTDAMTIYGGNPGRSGHRLSAAAAEAVYRVREKAADMFGGNPENVVFTSNCTHSLNFAIKGLLEQDMRAGNNVHVIISDLEHNSVARPVFELTSRSLSCSVAHIGSDDLETAESFERLITPKTKAIISTLGSNVTGRLLPWRLIGDICKRHDICFIADGAQVCGVLPVSLADGINILCMPGHKGLFGIAGTGLLITDGKFPLYHIMEGGTGSTSMELTQTPFLPEGLESGTINTPGILSVGAGIDFISRIGMENIHAHEEMLCGIFVSALSHVHGVRIYREEGGAYLPIVLFNIDGFLPEETAAELDRRGFALRAGLHCSGLGHKAAGTFPDGGVRFAPSCFNSKEEVFRLVLAVKSIAGNGSAHS